MNKFSKVLFAVAITATASGCESFLDINNNPNRPTAVTPDAILATALTTTGAIYSGGINTGDNYNSYAAFAVGHLTKSGTVSGFSNEQTYNYSNSYYQNLFRDTYDNLNDYNIIQQQGATTHPNHAAIARIMKVYDYLLLVDEYGDVPYTDALKGIGNTAPAYDKAQDIYKDFIVQLKGAVTDINGAKAGLAVGREDVVFGGNMTKWKQFANSLRLRILLRQSQTNDAALNTYVVAQMAALQTESAADGFIEADVVVQPGYAGNTDQQNPFYTRYGFAAGAVRNTSEYSFVVPTQYLVDGYVTNKDPRITQLYRVGKKGGVAAYSGGVLGESSAPIFDPAGDRVGSRFLNGGTFLRGANAPTVLMLLAEHHFSKAEAATRGLFTGGATAAKADYLNGVKASFLQTYRLAADPIRTLAQAPASTSGSPSSIPGVAQYEQYLLDNVANPQVNYDLATTSGALGKQSIILFQKYLAENIVASTEAWDDYRRAAKPPIPISLRAGTNPFPKRLLYPLTETSTNNANVPKGVTQFTKIFWDVLD